MTRQEDQPPPPTISDHGMVGDLRTAALVATDGSIDWFCPGRFDAPSVFARLLDTDKGGSWDLRPVDGEVRAHQFYFPDSNILNTRFLTDEGMVEVHDFMPLLKPDDAEHRQRLVRRVQCVRGEIRLAMRLAARPDYARERPTLREVDGGVLIESASLRLGLSATADLRIEGDDVVADLRLSEGDRVLLVLEVLDAGDGDDFVPCQAGDADALFGATNRYWQDWIGQSSYKGRWRETVNRSALTLKMLCHEPSGGIVAAVTTSLPEEIGGGRNWDYRYVWIRDAGFSLYALLRLGFLSEAAAFIRWLSERLGEQDEQSSEELGPLRVLYDLDGNIPSDEEELDHLAGYAGSKPVRVGNAAAGQLQLDIYGDLIDSIYLYNKYGPGISYDAWQDLRRLVDWLLEHWDAPDAGMWESRDEPRQHTTSRIMEWVAIERAVRVARQRGLPGDITEWSRVRDEIYANVMDECWDDEQQTFVQATGSKAVDAGLLLMPQVKFVAPRDPRFLSTLKVVEERLVTDTLVFRYDVESAPDGVSGGEGTFSLCSFWYVEALTRVGRIAEARLALEKMMTYANHLGLFAEQIGLNGEQLGNFPQAFTHLALISAAHNLDRELG
ncbi:glycoside hydrolase family 15 protein [Microlunatus flavus]|uniref:Glucoamylase (Glucan-1,4-alpha-glucosidase), GH15 family n=1 Tax=Microlunatus flavus TaxID=1036181 RepID=A0A1H9K193_9ACTN|nr:glycoside hydrolase family 15 protein [Microlunatus flavus]SEQ92860.1 Glucoamylase (glucan-1,4-alpha-glucosidase), GH15 family [Microlunatus flavus]